MYITPYYDANSRGNDSNNSNGIYDTLPCISVKSKVGNSVVGERSSAQTRCTQPCEQVTYKPQISFSQLPDYKVQQILRSDTRRFEIRGGRAAATQDHVQVDNCVEELAVLMDTLETYRHVTANFDSSQNGNAKSGLAKISQAVEAYLKLYKEDFDSLLKTVKSLEKTAKVLEVEHQDQNSSITSLLSELSRQVNTRSRVAAITNQTKTSTDFGQNLLLYYLEYVEIGWRLYPTVLSLWMNATQRQPPTRVFTNDTKESECANDRLKFLETINTIRNVVKANTEAMSKGQMTTFVKSAARVKYCFGEYFITLASTLNTFQEVQSDNIEVVIQQFSQVMADLDMRDALAPLMQDTRFMSQLVSSYLSGHSSKSDLASAMNSSMVTSLIARVGDFSRKIDARLFQKYSSILHSVENLFKDYYTKLLFTVANIQVYYDQRLYPDFENMNIWLRPLVSLTNNYIEIVNTNARNTIFSQNRDLHITTSGAGLAQFIQKKVKAVVDEHVSSYFQDVQQSLLMVRQNAGYLEKGLIENMGGVQRLSAKQVQGSLDLTYIK